MADVYSVCLGAKIANVQDQWAGAGLASVERHSIFSLVGVTVPFMEDHHFVIKPDRRSPLGALHNSAIRDSMCSSWIIRVLRGEGMHRETGSRTFAYEAVGEDLGPNERLEERLRNDLSWRRFVGLGLTDGTPDHTTISRFRNLVVERGLMRRVFEAVNDQFDEKGMILRHWAVVDATLVETRASRTPYRKEGSDARPRSAADPDATWGPRSFG